MTIPNITLNNGVAMPQLGYGVFQVPDDETEAAVTAALEAGYRSIDTAAVYGNEAGVGRALAKSGIAREELFITTKLWNSDHERPVEAYEKSLELLGLDQVDLYLIHWPTPARDLYVGAWQGLEELYAAGRTRAIGVSNFLPEHLDRLAKESEIVPAINQIELHPSYQQRELTALCRERSIAIAAYSPLGQGHDLDLPVLASIAGTHDVTPAQVVLRWHLHQGHLIIPKSVAPERIRANFDLGGFELTDEEIASITAAESGHRIGNDPRTFALSQIR